MAKPKGFAHHAKAAQDAHDSGDHDMCNHHIGKMFGMNRNAKKGRATGHIAEAVEEALEQESAPHNPRARFAKLRGS